MKVQITNFKPQLLFLLAVIGINPAYAATYTDEIHLDANMRYLDRNIVAKTYGYLRVIKGSSSNVLVETMFSNGNPSIDALFNASILFLDDSGRVLRRANLNCPLGAGATDEATECKVSKIIKAIPFDSVEVNFYLSGISNPDLLAMQ